MEKGQVVWARRAGDWLRLAPQDGGPESFVKIDNQYGVALVQEIELPREWTTAWKTGVRV